MTALRVLTAEPLGEGIVERLEYALDLARNGELSSVGVAMVHRDGSSEVVWSRAPSVSALLGATARLSFKLNMELENGH